MGSPGKAVKTPWSQIIESVLGPEDVGFLGSKARNAAPPVDEKPSWGAPGGGSTLSPEEAMKRFRAYQAAQEAANALEASSLGNVNPWAVANGYRHVTRPR